VQKPDPAQLPNPVTSSNPAQLSNPGQLPNPEQLPNFPITQLPDATSVIIPALDEGPAIGSLIAELRAAADWREILVVDDGSADDTAQRAADAGARVIRHPYNKGNGAAVKTGIRQAKGTFVLIVDGDGQHRPADAVRLVSHLDAHDLVVGARSPSSQASWVRRLGNSLLNAIAGFLAGRRIPDLTSGFRAARRECLLEFLHLLPNGFSTPTTTTLAFMKAGYSVRFEPIAAARRTGVSKMKLGSDGVRFFLILLKVMTIFSPLRIFLPVSLASFVLGAAYAAWTIATQSHVTNSSVLLILLSVVIFLIGLVSEQISSLRFEGRER
jgi:glycosyltransferase involved in cell wall biosynthesis